MSVGEAPGDGDRSHAFEVGLFAACEYGRPLWRVRSAVVCWTVTVATGAVLLAVRLLHPLHPYRVYLEGSAAVHRDMQAARVPTRRQRTMGLTAKVLWCFVAYLVAADVVAFLPGVGVFPSITGHEFHVAYTLGFVDEPTEGRNLIRALRDS